MKRRQGFTLVELLVSMALIIFIMAILSQAFQAALGTFRNLKAQGDMAEKLRSTMQILERDLAADHFRGGKRLSDPSFWTNGPPQQGFFRVWHGTPSTALGPNNFLEGADTSGIGSYRSIDHSLAFTVKLRGNDMGDFFSASAVGSGLGANLLMSSVQSFGPPESRYQATSGGAYNFQWAEVAWFMQPQINPNTLIQDVTAPDPAAVNPVTGFAPAPPLPLFTLSRRQRLLVPDNNLVALDLVAKNMPPLVPITQYANYLEVSCSPDYKIYNNLGTPPGNLYFNNPADITIPWRRFGMVPPNPAFGSYPAGMLFCAIPPYVLPYPPWSAPWPAVVPLAPPPWGSWMPPYLAPAVPYTATATYPTMAQQSAPLALIGADTQLNDVISFDVRAFVVDPLTSLPLATNVSDPFVTMFDVLNAHTEYQHNTAFYSSTNLAAPAVFDTWTSIDDGLGTTNYPVTWSTKGLTGIPMWNGLYGPSIRAIQVTIRIWDFKTNQARQVTIVQAM